MPASSLRDECGADVVDGDEFGPQVLELLLHAPAGAHETNSSRWLPPTCRPMSRGFSRCLIVASRTICVTTPVSTRVGSQT